MPLFSDYPVATLKDVIKFESEKTLEQRYDARSVYDIFAKSAAKHPDRIALTMLMTGAEDETPRLVTYRQMLDGVTRAANFFASLGGAVRALPTSFPVWSRPTSRSGARRPPVTRCRSTSCSRHRTSPISSRRLAQGFWWHWVRIRSWISGRKRLRSENCCRTSSWYMSRCLMRRYRKVSSALARG